MIVLCAFCRALGWPPGARREPMEWVSQAEYRHRGGRRDLPVSHGACPSCVARVLAEDGLDDVGGKPLHASVLKR